MQCYMILLAPALYTKCRPIIGLFDVVPNTLLVISLPVLNIRYLSTKQARSRGGLRGAVPPLNPSAPPPSRSSKKYYISAWLSSGHAP